MEVTFTSHTFPMASTMIIYPSPILYQHCVELFAFLQCDTRKQNLKEDNIIINIQCNYSEYYIYFFRILFI